MMFPKKIRKNGGKNALDRVFSEYIRLRDSSGNGLCRCITCSKTLPWKAADAGHFIERDRLATRYNEQNVNAQCPRCNRFRNGEQFLHGLAIDRKYGKGTAEMLEAISRKPAKLGAVYYEEQIKKYREKVKKLRKKVLDFQ